MKLRKFDPYTKAQAMFRINEVLYEYEMYTMNGRPLPSASTLLHRAEQNETGTTDLATLRPMSY